MRGREGGAFRGCKYGCGCTPHAYTRNRKPSPTTPGAPLPFHDGALGRQPKCAGRMTPKRRPRQSVGARDAAGPGDQTRQASAPRRVERCCAQRPPPSSQGHGVLCPPRRLLGQEPPPWPPALWAEAQSFSWVYSWEDK